MEEFEEVKCSEMEGMVTGPELNPLQHLITLKKSSEDYDERKKMVHGEMQSVFDVFLRREEEPFEVCASSDSFQRLFSVMISYFFIVTEGKACMVIDMMLWLFHCIFGAFKLQIAATWDVRKD